MEELISVIIPVYNVGPFLPECLDSIINQSYKNLEIIIVNDGSTDGSRDICEKYRLMDSRIKLINQKNSGAAKARNVGIDNSSGKFLSFIDSDDYIHKDMIKILYDNIKKFNADISFCDYSIDKNEVLKNPTSIPIVLPEYEMFSRLYGKNGDKIISACVKLHKKELFNNIKFPAGKIYEDTFIIHKLIDVSKKIVYVGDKLYFYRMRSGSVTHSKYSLKQLEYLEVLLERMEFMKTKGYDYFYAREFYRYVKELKENYKKIKKYFPAETEKAFELIKEFNRSYNKNTRKLVFNKKIRLGLDIFHIRSLLIEKCRKF